MFRIVWYFVNMLIYIYFWLKFLHESMRTFSTHILNNILGCFLFANILLLAFKKGKKSLSLNMLTVNIKWHMIQTQTNEKRCDVKTRWKTEHKTIQKRMQNEKWNIMRITVRVCVCVLWKRSDANSKRCYKVMGMGYDNITVIPTTSHKTMCHIRCC